MPQKVKIASYTLLRKIGSGGMGVVYECLQEGLNRRVAVKFLHRKFLKDAIFLKRFKQEAQIAANLNHPNIVTIYEIGEFKGRHFFSMEYVDGVNLRAFLKKNKVIPVRKALSYMRQAADGLAHAWQHKMIHRDIKPDNLLITRKETLKILDLGLAKSYEPEHQGLTVSSAIMGTPYYMSPEQAKSSKQIDFRTDIYSLGATFYHLLTGQPPFQGESSLATIIKMVKEPLPLVREVNPSVPAPVARVIEKMLDKTPEARYQTADALLQAIDQAAAKLPKTGTASKEAIAARTGRRKHPSHNVVRRRTRKPDAEIPDEKPASRKGLRIILVAVLLAAASVAYYLYSGKTTSQPPVAPRHAKFKPLSSPDAAPAVEPDVAEEASHPLDQPTDPTDEASALDETLKQEIEANLPEEMGQKLDDVLALAEKYADEDPEGFKALYGRYKEIKKDTGIAGPIYEKRMQKAMAKQAALEFDRCNEKATVCMAEGRFADAFQIWCDFSKNSENDDQVSRVEKKQQAILLEIKQQLDLLDSDDKTLSEKDMEQLTGLRAQLKRISHIVTKPAHKTDVKKLISRISRIKTLHTAHTTTPVTIEGLEEVLAQAPLDDVDQLQDRVNGFFMHGDSITRVKPYIYHGNTLSGTKITMFFNNLMKTQKWRTASKRTYTLQAADFLNCSSTDSSPPLVELDFQVVFQKSDETLIKRSDRAMLWIHENDEWFVVPDMLSLHGHAPASDVTEQLTTGTMTQDGNLSFGDNTLVGMRFKDVDLPRNAIILKAYLVLTASEGQNGPATMRFSCVDSANAMNFSDTKIPSTLTCSAASVEWHEGPVWEKTKKYKTPNLGPLIQALVARKDWVSGNPVALIISSTGKRSAMSHEASMRYRPQLNVFYTMPGNSR